MDDRLVGHLHLALDEGGGDRRLELGTGLELQAQGLVEHLGTAAARCLGAVGGGVGLGEQRVGVGAAVPADGDADAGTDPDPRAVDRDLLADRRDEAVGQLDQVVLAADGLHEDDELVATEAADDVAGADGRAEPAGDGAQHLVAGRVAVAVVDRLEAVQVDEEQAGHLAGAPAAVQGGGHEGDGLGAVGQPGERVVGRLVGEGELQLLALADRVHDLLHGRVHDLAERAGERLLEQGVVQVTTGHGLRLVLDAAEPGDGGAEGGGDGAHLARAVDLDLDQRALADLGRLPGQQPEGAGHAAAEDQRADQGADEHHRPEDDDEVQRVAGALAVGGHQAPGLDDGGVHEVGEQGAALRRARQQRQDVLDADLERGRAPRGDAEGAAAREDRPDPGDGLHRLQLLPLVAELLLREQLHLPLRVGIVQPGRLPGGARADQAAVAGGEHRPEVERYLPARHLGQVRDGLDVADGARGGGRHPFGRGELRRGALGVHEVVGHREEAEVLLLDAHPAGVGIGPQRREVGRRTARRGSSRRARRDPGEGVVGLPAELRGLRGGDGALGLEQRLRDAQAEEDLRALDHQERQRGDELQLGAAAGLVEQGEGPHGVLGASRAGGLGGAGLRRGRGQDDDADQGEHDEGRQVTPQWRATTAGPLRRPEDSHTSVSAPSGNP
nr:hypothetical protein [Blastococcus sp. TML/C7B]